MSADLIPSDLPREGAPSASPVDWFEDPAIGKGIGILAAMDRWLFGMRFPLFCLVILAFAILQNGVGTTPNIEDFRELSRDVTRQLTQDSPHLDYLYRSFFGLALGQVTGAWKSTVAYASLHLAILGVGLVFLFRSVWRKFGDQTTRILALTLATVPLSNVLMTWLGMSDVYVFIFSTAIVLAESLPAIAALAFLLELSHAEQAILIGLGLAICRVCQVILAGRSWRAAAPSAAALLGGMIAANVSLRWYFAAEGFHLRSARLSYVMGDHWTRLWCADLHHPATMIFSFHGSYWLVILAATFLLWQTRRRLALGVIGVNLACAAVALCTLDETRVFGLLVWPFIVFLSRPDIFPTEKLRRYVVLAYVAGLVIPKLIVWDGTVNPGAL